MHTRHLSLLFALFAGCASGPHPVLAAEPPPGQAKVAQPLTDVTHTALTAVLDALRKDAADADVVGLYINTSGGSVEAGMDFIEGVNELRRSGVRVQCWVGARAYSMGFAILQMACDERFAQPTSTFMTHASSVKLEERHNARDLLIQQAELNMYDRAIGLACAARMGMDYDMYAARTDLGEWWMVADDALEFGAFDRLVDWRELPKIARANESKALKALQDLLKDL